VSFRQKSPPEDGPTEAFTSAGSCTEESTEARAVACPGGGFSRSERQP
jgi:hypothetical protein